MVLKRLDCRCILRPEDLPPSDDRLESIGAFNPGAVEFQGDVIILVRIAEQLREKRSGFTAIPYIDPERGLQVEWEKDEDLVFLDPRIVRRKRDGFIRLTFVSHLRVVRSRDGKTIDSVDGPMFEPLTVYDEFGVEDPRITPIGDQFYITYVCVSRHGATTALASTSDFVDFKRHGVIFVPENKDVVFFPEKIGGDYVALHRPTPYGWFSIPEMWLARSQNLTHWGKHEFFFGGGASWETGRIGAGPPPVKTPEGWLEIYHGSQRPAEAGKVGVYSAGAFLLDLDNPARIVRHAREPLMVPETDFEREGFVPNVVFPTGIVERGESFLVYYGAADTYTGVVEFAREDLFNILR